MHHALEIQEILAKVFRHCVQIDLSSLARTCRAFKEPALDALWAELKDLTPLARCLPEASQQRIRHQQRPIFRAAQYSLRRPLTRTEWDILRRYSCRIRSITQNPRSCRELDERSLQILSNPPTTEPVFPNLRSLRCPCDVAALLFHLPLPSLLSVAFTPGPIRPTGTPGLDNFLQTLPQLCPNARFAHLGFFDNPFTHLRKATSDCICGWQRLENISCPDVPLDPAAIVHLSRMGGLARLYFILDVLLPHFVSPLIFSNLRDLNVRSKSWRTIYQFLSRVRLPVAIMFSATVRSCPSRLQLSSIFANLQTSGASSTIGELQVCNSWSSNAHRSQLLGLDDLQPCMAFSNLSRVHLDVEWSVGLTDGDLLALTSAWPRLKQLLINPSWGWSTTGGITPTGLLRLLQMCPSLCLIALAMDTRNSIEFATSSESLGPTLPRPFAVHVVDSIIEENSVSSVAAFFAHVASFPGFRMYIGGYSHHARGRGVYERRWKEVYAKARDLYSSRCQSTHT